MSENTDAVAQAREDKPPFVDTPVLSAKRKAFDAPTQENLDLLIAAVEARCADRVREKRIAKEGWSWDAGFNAGIDASLAALETP